VAESNIKMKLILLLTSLLLPIPAICASQNWEACLDKADFSFNVDGFMGSVTATKNICSVKFALSGGKGEKFEFDLCDPVIHIDYYAAIDADTPRRIAAGSAGCPTPLFGADFDEGSKDVNDYRDMRRKILDAWEKVKAAYGEDADKVDLNKPDSFSPKISAGKIACGQYLLREYLTNCMAFEATKPDPKESAKTTEIQNTAPSNIPGVHPQTILVPKK